MMRIIILNWSGGENDPFTYYSLQLQRKLQVLGHEVYIVPFAGPVGQSLYELHTQVGIDMAVSWQGIGSTIAPTGRSETLWELLRIPLLCLHGDHPCYNPANHQQGSPYVQHVYPSASFANAANRLIPRQWPALPEEIPIWFTAPDDPLHFDGDYFVFPKNFQHIDHIREEWKTRANASTLAVLERMAKTIESVYLAGNVVNHHEVILDELPRELAQRVRAGDVDEALRTLVFTVSRELDRVHRNIAAAFVLDVLVDTPIRIYGRGWEHYAAKGNPLHEFHPARTLADARHQFSSSYGILDVAPSNDTLHDRSFRAMMFGAGLLISSAWRRNEAIHQDHADLFFNGDPDELRAKVAAVRADPQLHRERASAFGRAFETEFTLHRFLERVVGEFRARGINL